MKGNEVVSDLPKIRYLCVHEGSVCKNDSSKCLKMFEHRSTETSSAFDAGNLHFGEMSTLQLSQRFGDVELLPAWNRWTELGFRKISSLAPNSEASVVDVIPPKLFRASISIGLKRISC